ncbi:hypothetical protein SARC_00414 [Sphaeroforma arctica JP610]|uniref:Ubiquitin-like 1-activating enzyme E1A n=1 Tax=Sphaeroforma arctica JP610 TaxID=667725 RepID=A0A0L0GF26_9EUKA|nr:hypothetical protein SARC_00414 [Sphaeroforma arctica JP610]KNC87479.1 hypothetical protein SARC_00414 [Sphaeroforma arctica JP610]|eukprot:XP_014161381.1 hypothetical protein SARC_00414 [Sphaeroforma arctica JP610]
MNEDETTLYDRQIRLWGAEAQQRMSSAHILVDGVKALANEVLKTIVLAGVGSVTILDHHTVEPADLTGTFLSDKATAVGLNRVQAALGRLQDLNPRVKLHVDTDIIDSKSDDYFKQFNIICLTDTELATAMRVNRIAREAGVLFFWAGLHGYYGFFFEDLGDNFEYIYDQTKDQETKTLTATTKYPSLEEAVHTDSIAHKQSRRHVLSWIRHGVFVLHRFHSANGRWPTYEQEGDVQKMIKLRNAYVEENKLDIATITDAQISHLSQCGNISYGPAAAIVGGVLGQEILKAN